MKETTKKETIGTITELPLELLVAFAEHPFKPYSGEQLWDLVKSIEEHGVLSPILVRPAPDGQRYEIISGHNRVNAARRAGLKTIPATVREMDDDEATLAMVESNLRQREQLLPSEKARAYKMRYDAMSHQGSTSRQVGAKLRTSEELAQIVGDSARQIQRFIRLTNLITPILDMVDEKRMAMGPAVELSYLNRDEQEMLLDLMQIGDCTPSLSQAIRLRKLSEAGNFDSDHLDEIMDEEKPNQREKVTFKLEDLIPFFPEAQSVGEIRDIIMKLIEREVKRRRKERSDDRDR